MISLFKNQIAQTVMIKQIMHIQKQTNNAGDFRCTMSTDFVIPRGLVILYRCSLTTLAEDKPYRENLLIRNCCNHKENCTLFRLYLTIAAGISSSSFVRISTRQLAVSSLFKGISSTLNFHESIGRGGSSR